MKESKRMTNITCVVDCRCQLGEGPVWCPIEQALYWVNIPAPVAALHRFHPASGVHEQWRVPEVVSAVALYKDGRILLTCKTGVKFFDRETGQLTLFVNPEPDKPGNRFNDGKTDRKGRYWGGTMGDNMDAQGKGTEQQKAQGTLYRIDPDGTSTKMDDGFTTFNTCAWSPDNRILYAGDSEFGIYAYDFDLEGGTISNKRPFFKQPDDFGFTDGSTIDTEGYLWNARWGAGKVIRISPDGKIDRVIEMPVSQPSSCMFGGENLDILYVTSARQGLSEEQLAREPQAGSLFALEVGARGLPEPRFGA
jgi:L-arabinonolactonase